MFKNLLTILFFNILFYSYSFAQNLKKDTNDVSNSISVSGSEGLLIFAAKGNSIGGNFWGTEVAYNINLKNNSSDWVRLLKVKNASIIWTYFNLNNLYLKKDPNTKGFLGNDYSILGGLALSVFQYNKVDLLLTPGLGLTYASKTYQTNYNPFVGSHINLAAQIGLKLEVPFLTTTKIQFGFNVFHYSNAAFKLPNDGVNNLYLSLGIVNDINYKTFPRILEAYNMKNKNALEFGFGFGHRGLVQVNRGLLSATDSIQHAHEISRLNNAGFYAGYNYRLNSLLSLRAGTDIIYYSVTYNVLNSLSTSQGYGTSLDKFSVGTSVGTDLWLGRFVFATDYGYYLHLKYALTPINTYWKFGAKYYLTKFLALEAKEYLHGTEAHYANFGLLFHVF